MDNINTKVKKYEIGIWTSNGFVVCSKCRFDREDSLVEVDKENLVTTCNKCGKEIQVHYTIANENNLVTKLRSLGIDSYMEQIGGMNSACNINKKDDKGFYWVTYDWNLDNDYFLCSYDDEGEQLEDFYYIATNLDDIVNFITNLKDVKKL